MEFLRKWWTEPVPPGWLQSYLEANGLDRSLRTLIGWYALVFAAICVVAQFSNAAPTTLFGRAVVGVCAIGSLAWALRWFVGSWASRTESMIFVAFADVGIAASASQLSTDLSLGTAMLFTPIGAYVSFFLGNRQLLAHAIWCITVICALAVPLAVPGPAEIVARVIAMAICQMLVVVLVPVVIQFGIAMVRLQAMASWRDPLTGIFNRRGIFDEWQRKHRALVAGDEIAHGRVVAVATVDIDRYKLVNDTHGHDAGDRVLIECAEALSEQHDSRTIVGRSGGDEFLVITLCAAESISDLARALGDRIATCAPTDLAVTASIGIATDSVIAVTAADPQSAIESLISRADIAMYEAKRNGGNQFRIAPQCVNDCSP